MNMDLRNSPEDHSLRMLNAIEPGTLLPIHRHRESSETVVMLRGKGRWNYYDDHGNLTETFVLSSDGDLRGALRPPRPVTQRREPRKRHGAAGMPGREVGAAEGRGCDGLGAAAFLPQKGARHTDSVFLFAWRRKG